MPRAELAHIHRTEVLHQPELVLVEEVGRGLDVVGVPLPGGDQPVAFLDEALGVVGEGVFLGDGLHGASQVCRELLGYLTGFEARGLLGGANDVLLGDGVQNARHPEGAGVGLIDCDAPAYGDDVALEGVFGLAHRP